MSADLFECSSVKQNKTNKIVQYLHIPAVYYVNNNGEKNIRKNFMNTNFH